MGWSCRQEFKRSPGQDSQILRWNECGEGGPPTETGVWPAGEFIHSGAGAPSLSGMFLEIGPLDCEIDGRPLLLS